MTSSIAVTVIVPMRNEERCIERCLKSILVNDFPKDQWEILVADGMSTDHSRPIVAGLILSFPRIRMIDNPAKITSSGLNNGILQARGDVIIIMGAHSEYPDNYITTCMRELEKTQADVVGGRLNTQPGADTLVARTIALMSQHPFGVGPSAFRTGNVGKWVDTVPYGAYKREVFQRAGLFNEELARNQDYEFNARVRKAGGRLFLSPALEVAYYNVPNAKRLAVQAFNNGFWLPRMWYACPASICIRHSLPLIFTVALLGGAVLSLFTSAGLVLLAVLLLAYGLAAGTAAMGIALHEGKQYFFLLLGLFFIHHFIYGLGSLAGFFTVLPRRSHNAGPSLAETAIH
ncbi:MAG: glycosyltransferase family 2 protein [Acidobacteriia bacterium]|nr:glycosyltransferase family 2 protein [Terriglobia bacterium]